MPEPEKNRELEVSSHTEYIQRLPAVLEILVSLKFIPSAHTAHLSPTTQFPRNLSPTYVPGRVALALCLGCLHLGAVLACFLDQLDAINAVSTHSTHICSEQGLPCVNTQSVVPGRGMVPEGEACAEVLNGSSGWDERHRRLEAWDPHELTVRSWSP